MNTELKNAVKATDKDAQYDTSAKRLLGQKSILAHILVKTVDEFKGMNPKDVVNCIEGTPHISTVPVEPGLTNAASEKNGERLVGFNTENEEINEGLKKGKAIKQQVQSKINFNDIIDSHENTIFYSDNDILEFETTMIEPTYEYFETVTCVKLNGNYLYKPEGVNIAAYKNKLIQKIIASILILIGVIIIKM